MESQVKIFSSKSQWLYALNGSIFFHYDKFKWFKLFVVIMIHGFYFWRLTNIGAYLREYYFSQHYPGTAIFTTIFCRTLELCLVFSKVSWFYRNSRKMTEFLMHLENTDEQNRIEIDSIRIRRYWIPTSMVLYATVYFYKLLVERKFSEADYIFCFLFPSIKDTLEFCFWDDVLHTLGQKFNIINKKLIFHEKSAIGKKHSFRRGEIERPPFIEREIRFFISQIRKSSRRHQIFVDLTRKFSLLSSPIVAVTLVVKLIEVINGVHFIITYLLQGDSNVFEAVRRVVWCSLMFQYCVVMLKSWTDISSKANETSLLLHDIWNKYAEKRIHKELLYLQLMSTRLLSTKLNFTAYGFFPLNCTFLHTMVASAATYIIILIQLKG